MTSPTPTNTDAPRSAAGWLDRALDSAALVVRDNRPKGWTTALIIAHFDEETALAIAMIVADVMHLRMDRYDASLVGEPVDSCYFDWPSSDGGLPDQCGDDCATLACALPAALQRFLGRRDDQFIEEAFPPDLGVTS